MGVPTTSATNRAVGPPTGRGALGVPALPMFTPVAYLTLVALGVLVGAVGRLAVRRTARDPRRVLTLVVPLVLVVSVVPDVLIGVAGVPVGGVVTLIVMRLAVGAVAVPLFACFLPLPARRHASSPRQAHRMTPR